MTGARERIVAAAAQCFAANGVERTSLDEIATAAGVHRATLHRHFTRGRDQLVAEVIDQQAHAAADDLLAALATARSARDGLAGAMTATVTNARQDRVVAAILALPGARAAAFGPASATLRARGQEVWLEVVALAGRTGEVIAPDLDPAEVTDHLLRVMESLVAQPGAVDDAAAVERYVRAFVVPALIGPPVRPARRARASAGAPAARGRAARPAGRT